MSKTVIVTW